MTCIRHTIEIRTDIQHARLGTRDRLRKPEHRRTQRPYALRLQHRRGIQRRPRRRNLDEILRLRDAHSLEFPRVCARMVNHGLRVVRLMGVDLQRDTALDVIDVGFAHADADAVVDGEPALIFELAGGLLDKGFVRGMGHLYVGPDVVACHVVWGYAEFGGHAYGEVGVHPVDVDVDCGL